MATNLDLEKLVLRLLCLGSTEGVIKESVVPWLRDYPWRTPLHEVIFNAIVAIPSNDPVVLRQLLPAKLTRMGFPDVEWEEFFELHSLSREESMLLVRRMIEER